MSGPQLCMMQAPGRSNLTPAMSTQCPQMPRAWEKPSWSRCRVNLCFAQIVTG